MSATRTVPALLALVLLASGCGGSATQAATEAPRNEPAASPGPVGDLSKEQLRALLLRPEDTPDLPVRRDFAAAELSRQAVPQLALCQDQGPAAPHQLANVLVKSGEIGTVQVFEILAAYADASAAAAAYAADLATARACPSFPNGGRVLTLQDLTVLPPTAETARFQYRLTTPDVIGGDVRTLGRRGRFTVLVTGYGKPPAGQTLLGYQAAVITRALDRLVPPVG